jgi:eukaryotic-like serine/threonine-protein kinase
MRLAAGTRLGPYEITSPIGAGGMGEVYRARDTRLDRTVAIKVLPASTASDADCRARFEREAKTIAGLNHPHICTLHDVGDYDGSMFLVMEHVAGETLAARLREGPLRLEQALTVATEIADALAAAHRQGIIHRDLKPGNVMLTRAGAKLLDFGLAKLRLAPSVPSLAAASLSTAEPVGDRNLVLGTVPYMAPEQLEGKEADARSDIFSFGAMLYEMVTGKRPFEGASQVSVMSAILSSEPPPLSAVRPGTAPGLDRLVRRCLAKDPDARWQSASDLADELRWLAGGSGSLLEVAVVRRSTARTRRVRALALVGALAAAMAVFWWIFGAGLRDRQSGHARAGAIQTVAVLPLENLSRDAGQDYFVDGMTEALIADLGAVGSLRVTSRTSVMQYKGTKRFLPDIARALHADAVIEGSVMRVGDRVRITAQLIEGSTDRHLWAQSYERDVRDILALQREVARAIASEVAVRLTPQEQARLARAGRVDPVAYEAYLRGRQECSTETSKGFENGIRWLEQSLARDPRQAATYASLSYCYTQSSFYGVPPSVAFAKAKAAATKAVELDDTLADGHAMLAYARLNVDWDWSSAEREIKRALELNPSSAAAHAAYAYYLVLAARYDEAIAEFGRRVALDPMTFSTAEHGTVIFTLARRYEEAIAQAKRALELAPGSPLPHGQLAWLYLRTGRFQEAVASALNARQLLEPGRDLAVDVFLAEPYTAAGRHAEVQAWLATWERRAAGSYVDGYNLAALCVALGHRDKAFEWLKKGYDQRSPNLLQLKTDAWLDAIRPDQRFEDLLRRVGFP